MRETLLLLTIVGACAIGADVPVPAPAAASTAIDRAADQAVLGAFVVDQVTDSQNGQALEAAIRKRIDGLLAHPASDADAERESDLEKHPKAKELGLKKSDFKAIGAHAQDAVTRGLHAEALAKEIRQDLLSRQPTQRPGRDPRAPNAAGPGAGATPPPGPPNNWHP